MNNQTIQQQITNLQSQMSELLAQEELRIKTTYKEQHQQVFCVSLELIRSQTYHPLTPQGYYGYAGEMDPRVNTLRRLSGSNYSHQESDDPDTGARYIHPDNNPVGPFRRDEVMWVRMLLGFETMLGMTILIDVGYRPHSPVFGWQDWNDIHYEQGPVTTVRQFNDYIRLSAFERISKDAFDRLNYDALYIGDAVVVKKLYNSIPTTGGTPHAHYQETINLSEPRESYVL